MITLWGDASEIRERHEELVVHLGEGATGRRLDIIVRVFDDGVGLRYARARAGRARAGGAHRRAHRAPLRQRWDGLVDPRGLRR